MLLSMTGHGAAHRSTDGLSVSAEVRTVNNRYYKLSLRASDGYSVFESRVDELVRTRVRRGTVYVDLRVDRQASEEDYRLNLVAVAAYARQLRQAANDLELESGVRLDLLAALPGVIQDRAVCTFDDERDWPAIAQTIEAALAGLTTMRRDEGRAMERDLRVQGEQIRSDLRQIDQRAPLVAASYRERLTDRINKLLAELGTSVQPTDLIREVGLFAERCDISEEVVRLRSHLDQFDEILGLSDSNGRKLDFLVQEMFRETNTIGSKANDAEISRRVVEIKTAIERIREMVQNVE